MATPGVLLRRLQAEWFQEGSYILTVPEEADLPAAPVDDDVFAFASAEETMWRSKDGEWLIFVGEATTIPHVNLNSSGGVTTTTTPTLVPGLTWTADQDYAHVTVISTLRFQVTATGTGYGRVRCYHNGATALPTDDRQIVLSAAAVVDNTLTGTWQVDDVVAGDVIELRAWRDGSGGTVVIGATQTRANLICSRTGVQGPAGPVGPTGPTGLSGAGFVLCTSTTRPTSPAANTFIQESDTGRVYRWDGSAWRYQYGGTNPTAFRAYLSANQTPTINVNTVVAFNTESYDYGNNYDTTNFRYTVPEDGLYSITVGIQISSPAAGERFLGTLERNAVMLFRGWDAGAVTPTRWGYNYSFEERLTFGDLIRVTSHQVNGTARALVGGSTESTFSIRKVAD